MSEIINGNSIVAGVAEGTLRLLEAPTTPEHRTPASGIVLEQEVRRFQDAVSALAEDLQRLAEEPKTGHGPKTKEGILEAHVLMLQDPGIHKRVQESIADKLFAAEDAVEHVFDEMGRAFGNSGNEVLRERAVDMRDLASQLCERLIMNQSGGVRHALKDAKQPVAVLPELLPSVVLRARDRGVRAFIVERGTAMSHGAILARAFGLPVLQIPSLDVLRRFDGEWVLVDGETGELIIEPGENERRRRLGAVSTLPTIQETRPLPARLWLNVMMPEELENFDWTQIEGVGLYLTKTLFLQQTEALPTEQEQFKTYSKLFALCGNRTPAVRGCPERRKVNAWNNRQHIRQSGQPRKEFDGLR